MIRRATADDISELLGMGERFAVRARLTDHVGYNPDHMAQTFQFLIDHHLLLIGDKCALGAIKTPHPFNFGHVTAQELFWWSEGREGLRLLAAYEDWGQENCHSISMITLEAVEPDRTAQIYLRRGFVPLERGFIKVF